MRFEAQVYETVVLRRRYPYHEATWHYQVREWRRDGEREYLAIVTDGCTDNIHQAHSLCNDSNKPRHIWDTRQERIVHRNY